MALNNDGRFYKDGQIAEIPGKDLMASAKPYYFTPAYNLVCYPNRDSSQFKEFYGLKDIQNLVRGTMTWKEMGFLEDTQREDLARDAKAVPWLELTAKVLGVDASEEAVISKLRSLKALADADVAKIVISKFRQLGLFSSTPITPRGSVMRTLAARLEETCSFKDGEVDIVLLQHTFEVERADGKLETITSTLEAYGDRNGGPSAMAKLVGVPCGMAVQFLLEGKLSTPGVRQPYDEETCALFRERLEKEEGITMVEKIV